MDIPRATDVCVKWLISIRRKNCLKRTVDNVQHKGVMLTQWLVQKAEGKTLKLQQEIAETGSIKANAQKAKIALMTMIQQRKV